MLAGFQFQQRLETIGRNSFAQMGGDIIGNPLLEVRDACKQAFFWYRHTWLILSILTLT
jgi:hypothetical protein